MSLGIFDEHQLPRPWNEDHEVRSKSTVKR
jgi:hypothetical protein